MSKDKQIFQEPKVKSFFNTLRNNNASVEEVEVLSAQRKKNDELLFAYLKITGIDSEDHKLLPYIFIRGDAVVIVPIIHITDKDDAPEYFLCVEQIRIADGAFHLEFPAGMLDEHVNNPAMVAIKEMTEETGLEITENMLIPLNNNKPLFTSPGACDEKIYYYKADIYINLEEFTALNGRIINNNEENERITLRIRTKEQFLAETKSNMGFVALSLLTK